MSLDSSFYKDFAYLYACKALSDGGYNSRTYRRFVPKGPYQTICDELKEVHERMNTLHLFYANKQHELGWPDLGDFADYATRRKLHDDALYLPDLVRSSAPYRAYLLYNRIPLISIINTPKAIRWRDEEVQDCVINRHLFDFVFN